MIEASPVTVDMQDAGLFQVEVDALFLGPGKQMLTRGDGQACSLGGVVAILRDGADKLSKPGKLVPTGLGIDQQWRIALEHPLHALDDGRPVVPDLGVRRRKLPAI